MHIIFWKVLIPWKNYKSISCHFLNSFVLIYVTVKCTKTKKVTKMAGNNPMLPNLSLILPLNRWKWCIAHERSFLHHQTYSEYMHIVGGSVQKVYSEQQYSGLSRCMMRTMHSFVVSYGTIYTDFLLILSRFTKNPVLLKKMHEFSCWIIISLNCKILLALLADKNFVIILM